MAYFQSVPNPSMKVLFVAVHFPHGTITSTWNTAQFIQDAKAVTESNDLSKINIIISGDMNELGKSMSLTPLTIITDAFGVLSISKGLPTCCSNSGYQDSFDHVAANHQASFNQAIIKNSVYPIGLSNDDEEHKAIYVEVKFP